MMRDTIQQVLREYGEMGYNTLFYYVSEMEECCENFDNDLEDLIECGIVCYDNGNYFLC